MYNILWLSFLCSYNIHTMQGSFIHNFLALSGMQLLIAFTVLSYVKSLKEIQCSLIMERMIAFCIALQFTYCLLRLQPFHIYKRILYIFKYIFHSNCAECNMYVMISSTYYTLHIIMNYIS